MNALVADDDIYGELKAAFESSTGDAGSPFGLPSSTQVGQPDGAGDSAPPVPSAPSNTPDSAKPTNPATGVAPSTGSASAAPASTFETAIDPPVRWTKEEKEEWAKIPADVQRILLERNKRAEGDLTKKFQFLAKRSREFADIEDLLKPREQFFKMNGDTAANYLSKVFAVSDFAEASPAEFIVWFAEQRGIDLLGLVDHLTEGRVGQAIRIAQQSGGQPREAQRRQNGQQGPVESVDPQARQVIGELRQAVETLAQQLQYERAITAQQQDQTVDQTLQSFADAKNDKGELLHPFLDEVEADMAVLYRNGIKDLEACYDRAVWGRPDLRQKLLDTERVKSSAEYQRAQQQRAVNANRAAVSVRATETPAPVSQTPLDDINAELRRNYEAVMSRTAARV